MIMSNRRRRVLQLVNYKSACVCVWRVPCLVELVADLADLRSLLTDDGAVESLLDHDVAALLILLPTRQTVSQPSTDTRQRTPVTGHSSPDTCHRTPVTGHLSTDTRQRTLITGHLSPDTRQWTLVTGHPSTDTRHRTLVTGHPSTDTRHRTPVTGHSSPDTRQPTLVTGHPSPDTRHSPPDTRHWTPITRHRTPVNGHSSTDTRHLVVFQYIKLKIAGMKRQNSVKIFQSSVVTTATPLPPRAATGWRHSPSS